MTEFEIIEKYFAKLTLHKQASAGLKDDAAVLEIPDGMELVVTSDTVNAGTHFLPDAAPGDIAHKALRVNLSDLAAMGAKAFCYQLNIAFPDAPDETWLTEFTDALMEDEDIYGIFCSGGDTTSIKGLLSISVTVLGLVPKGMAVRRDGAKAGDCILLDGTVGDAWIGLQILQGNLEVDDPEPFITAYKTPKPHMALGEIMQNYAHAAIDISDGLLADLIHLCKASDLAATVHVSESMFSDSARKLLDEGKVTLDDLLSGGDDYALLIAAAPEDAKQFGAHTIGRFESGLPDVKLLDENGAALAVNKTGWTHF